MQTDNTRIEDMVLMSKPVDIKSEFPLDEIGRDVVLQGRNDVNNILSGKDNRFMIITGPCSIHDEEGALDYAKKLSDLNKKVSKEILLVMRVYFEKPRTTIGWKGLINDPHLDGTSDINFGLKQARKILIGVTKQNLPIATEFLDPISPQFYSDLISWIAIGARTTESQTHRELASGVSAAVGFKNGTGGNLDVALNAMESSFHPHRFLGIDPQGQTCIVHTKGNEFGHLVLRGGSNGPNYDKESVAQAEKELSARGLKGELVIDCSHANSNKDHNFQVPVLQNVIQQKLDGNTSIAGVMLESNIHEGNQKLTKDGKGLAYGISITDKCLSWEVTETAILEAAEKLRNNN